MDSPTTVTPLSHHSSSKPLVLNEEDKHPAMEEPDPIPILKRKSPASPSLRHLKPKPRSNPIKYPNDPSSAPRRKGKNRPIAVAAATASPRNTRSSRRRLEKEIFVLKEENELFRTEDDVVARPRKKRQKGKQPPKLLLDEAQLSLVASNPDSCSMPNDGENNVLEVISELVMWKNVAKSTLWFGTGSMLFLSSSFSRDSNFSIVSAASHMGILILVIAFFHDSLPQRQHHKSRDKNFQLTEEDFLRAARLILPTANSVLAKCQKIFSGKPSITLKVAPVLLFTAKYGHLITPWRLLATGFFLSFTLPKVYSSFSEKIHQRVEEVRSYVKGAWSACPHKKLVATSTAMLLWNMSTLKMRIFAAFMSLVVLRHNKQQTGVVSNEIEREEESSSKLCL